MTLLPEFENNRYLPLTSIGEDTHVRFTSETRPIPGSGA
ncbi:hypothetical protein THTE_1940 [Thermogutta terrifontis]|uniref:Uncharacterized protein n=1 Tax=Thermogutta terrifontis TaxID=1331910 RepID=A0A286RF24_9BACT|nr:hypothetical protein THTE_1940 [Thermogutta terrifontis]